MRRAGFNIGLSKSKLAEEMYEILLKLKPGTKEIKEVIVFELAIYGQMATSRDINETWTKIKKKAIKEYPDKFIMDQRGSLLWNDGTIKEVDKKISALNFKKLNALAEIEKCDVNQIVTKLITHYQKK